MSQPQARPARPDIYEGLPPEMAATAKEAFSKACLRLLYVLKRAEAVQAVADMVDAIVYREVSRVRMELASDQAHNERRLLRLERACAGVGGIPNPSVFSVIESADLPSRLESSGQGDEQ